ncbi:dNTP triphosphohydrolase [Kribbella sp. NBC_01510]|uniref:deoxyguanosinetriphosphate triphosphohydrolase family protein n=1 Tax=Kribbella sp. NBC_01510 TaxID=2903581 RepID=UPI003865BDBA
MPPKSRADERVYGVNSTASGRITRPSGRSRRPEEPDVRSQAQRDRDRILYSAAWRRLTGVTQVITPFDDLPLMHNRLTHSEKVGQVARSIAERLVQNRDNWADMEKLGGFDVEVCEAAALAHDLGHPPFGHIGEQILDEVAREILGLPDGFEGNAQTFRLLTIGKVRSLKYEGLDQTYATLAAAAKYPWMRVARRSGADHDDGLKADSDYRRHWNKFSAYEPQGELLATCRDFANGIGAEIQTLEASVMDVADDITYAVHDLEDFYIAGVLDVSAIREDLDEFGDRDLIFTPFKSLGDRLAIDYPGWFSREALKEAAGKVENSLKIGFERHRADLSEVEARARGKGSDLIGSYIAAVTMQAAEPLWPGGPHIGLKQAEWHEVQILKEITRSYVVQRPDIALLQRGQQTVIENLVQMLHDWVRKDRDRLPPRLRREVQIAEELGAGKLKLGYGHDSSGPRGGENRAILDYICGFTDQHCLALYYKLSGIQVHRMSMTSML